MNTASDVRAAGAPVEEPAPAARPAIHPDPVTDNSAALAHFDVVGTPAPQGSKKLIRGSLVEASDPTLRNWRRTVAERAREIAEHLDGAAPLDGALHLDVEFRFPMPESRSKRVREAGRAHKTTAPDLDKLLRALGDSLTDGGLIRDDARFASLCAAKFETTGWHGARIRIGRP